MISLDRCNGIYNILHGTSGRISVPNKTKDANVSVFNMIITINESKILTKQYHANVNVNLIVKNVTQIKVGITIILSVSVKPPKKMMCVEKIIFGILAYGLVKVVTI